MPGCIGWMLTPKFRRHLLTYIPLDALLTTMPNSREFEETTREYIARRVESGEMIFHRGVDIVMMDFANKSDEERRAFVRARNERNKLVTQVIFLQNLPRIGDYACFLAVTLVVVDVPEGVESIGQQAFANCRSLTTVSFPTTLTSISWRAFYKCSRLDVDLFHTNLQELGGAAFGGCSDLKSMTIPDSLQKLRGDVFDGCSKLVPSNINIYDKSAVFEYLCSKQPNAM
ncbi:hypothetical protein TrLO_g1691 [Triparma laevis f. longispina]|uniref:Leucine-rich repeat domain-containing protein n=1 Tax=Triparma laevis f. longispina TaxID=1714387 RepID=A0A9W7FRC5_9STRA|nr:hypothetical protein TrLO_g1691 [Triparma laevis f. longispina]